MSHKIDKLYLVKSVKELDDLVCEEKISQSVTSFHNTNLSNMNSMQNPKTTPKEVTIIPAIENYIEAERHITVANHEKAYLCLIRFLKEIQRVIDNGVLEKDHYSRHKDIYDYYMSDEVKSRTFQKLALLREYLHSEYTTMTEMSADDREKCVSLPNDISVAQIEPFEQQSRKSFDIFNINNVLRNPDYLFGSDRYTDFIYKRIKNQKPTLRKCVSIPNGLDMKCNEGLNCATNTPKNKIHHNFTEYSVSDRVKSITTGYSHIIAPLIVKQTLLKIEEYKQKVELKPKSKNFNHYEWQKNGQIYMFRAIKF